ncbi:MAG: hypothetical protein HY820_18690 [Acidobacteria bacterium]|nr:hypothetical protein [Acidobacteriota bacterium]
MPLERREFLHTVAASGLAASATAAPAPIPTVPLGKFQVTRLIGGYNPIGGHSHSVPKLSVIMRNWFTLERTRDYLLALEKNGINTWQASIDPKAFQALRLAREAGSKLQWICLMNDATDAQWKEIIDLKPIAVVHHGGVTDRLYRAGQQRKIRDFIDRAHDLGVMAGVSSHVPEHIALTENSSWTHDLYMTCFYNVVRDMEKVRESLGDAPVDELYLSKDPEKMTAVVRQVKRPCLGFKIFAAGRLSTNAGAIERSFRYAYSKIKPGDAVIVGMFPIVTDEVAEDASIARKVLGGGPVISG